MGIGPEAIVAINITAPIFSILLSISLWMGIGGATLYSIFLGQKKYKEAQAVFTQSFGVSGGNSAIYFSKTARQVAFIHCW
ncbi:MATE family efflux transporter [Brevibacillus fortis]|uniref:MATE family efflux transporter n=1 Tax=Brevibacillus fortis TaxID=2126352 RepID=UPI0038FC7B19